MQFGTPDHFCIDYVNFIVTDFDSTYHAILGRPALTKFMAVLHYGYLVLKMPTEQGVLTLRGSVYTAYTCEEESCQTVEASNLSVRMEEIRINAMKTPSDHLEIPVNEAPHKMNKSKDHKTVELVEGDSSKTALIGANLDPK